MKRLVTIALLVVLLATMLPSVASAKPVQETLVAPFEYGPYGVETVNTYSGVISIRVSGYGQSAGPRYNDAFYIFTDDYGDPIVPEHIPDFYLAINGEPATNYTKLPDYRADHVYEFKINVKNSKLRFTFGVGDWYTADNSGSFTITVEGGSGPSSKAAPAGYVSQPSYTGDCLNRPVDSICLGFDDGYIWFIPDFTFGCNWDWNENAGTWNGHIVQVITDCDGSTYAHIMRTDYVSRGDKVNPAPDFTPPNTSDPSAGIKPVPPTHVTTDAELQEVLATIELHEKVSACLLEPGKGHICQEFWPWDVPQTLLLLEHLICLTSFTHGASSCALEALLPTGVWIVPVSSDDIIIL